MKVLGWIGLLVFLLLACLNFNSSQSLTFWELSVVVTEYGQWAALLSFVLMFFFLRNLKVLGTLVVITALYLIPTIQLHHFFPRWENELTGVFGNDPQDPAVSLPEWKRLWNPLSVKPKPETYLYDPAEKLQLDFFRAAQAHAPFLLVIHGGGWNSGERNQFADMNQYFANEGYSVASIDYRLAPQFKWPAPKNDVLTAIHYLKEHANELGIDANKWVIFGRSAGGQIAESVAYSSPMPEGLKGCISFYAPADLNFAYLFGQEDDILKSPSLLRDYLGGDPKQVRSAFDDASPILSVNRNSPPTLLMHGPRDSLVWEKQSERLYGRLQMAGVPSVYIRVPWATHGFDYNLNGPGGQIATFAVGRFLGKAFSE